MTTQKPIRGYDAPDSMAAPRVLIRRTTRSCSATIVILVRMSLLDFFGDYQNYQRIMKTWRTISIPIFLKWKFSNEKATQWRRRNYRSWVRFNSEKSHLQIRTHSSG